MNSYQIASWVERGDFAYFVPYNASVLVEYDMKKNKTMRVYNIDNAYYGMGSIIEIVKYNDELILVPLHYFKIVIFNCVSKTFRYLDIPYMDRLETKNSFFSKGIIKDNFLFLVGHNYRGTLRIDLQTEDIKIINEYVERVQKEENDNGYPVELDVAYNEHYIYLISTCDGNLVEISLDNCESTIYTLNDKKYDMVTWMNGSLWLIGNGCHYAKWNRGKGIIDEGIIPVTIPCDKKEKYPYRRSVGLNDRILLLSTEHEMPMIVLECTELQKSKDVYLDGTGVSAYFPNIVNGLVTFWDAYSTRTCIWDGSNFTKQCWDEGDCLIPYFIEKSHKGLLLNEREMSISSYLHLVIKC